MNKQQALEFITQALNDYMLTMAQSVKVPFGQVAQQAINVLKEEAIPKDKPDASA